MTPLQRETFFLPAQALPNPLPGWEHHAHSTHSDGHATLTTMAEAALAMGLRRLVFTEHTEPALVGGAGWFGRYMQEVGQLRQQMAGKLELIAGLEVPILDLEGHLGMDGRMETEVAFILGAVHAYPGFGLPGRQIPPRQAIELEFELLLALVENPRVDALAHPGGMCHLYVTPFPLERFEAVVQKAVKHGVAIELNPAYQEPLWPYLEICQRHGALISPGSNAHTPAQLGDAWRKLTEAAG